MSYKEVQQKRKEGLLAEALEMAKADYKNNENDIWNKRSLAWVYDALLKECITSKNYKYFVEIP